MIKKELSYGEYENIPADILDDEKRVKEFCDNAIKEMEEKIINELKKDHDLFKIIRKRKTIGVILTVAYQKGNSVMLENIEEEMNL